MELAKYVECWFSCSEEMLLSSFLVILFHANVRSSQMDDEGILSSMLLRRMR